MELKTRIWMTGGLEWFGYVGTQEMFLGRRSFPNPLAEGDEWTTENGDMFKLENGEIKLVGTTEPPNKYW